MRTHELPGPTAVSGRSPAAPAAAAGGSRIPYALQVSLAFATMTLAAAACLPLLPWSTPRTRTWARRIAKAQGRLILAVCGVRLEVQGRERIPDEPVVYVFNHPSTLDLFALVALGLPRTRFFLSGHLRALLPMGVVAGALGTFWTVPQTRTERRRQIFANADRQLTRTGESVALSPEGRRLSAIGPFNKGAFHLATSLRRPIVPLYLHIPDDVNPGTGWRVGRGVMQVVVQPPIDTTDWRTEDVVASKEAVRERYLQWQEEWSA